MDTTQDVTERFQRAKRDLAEEVRQMEALTVKLNLMIAALQSGRPIVGLSLATIDTEKIGDQ